MIFQMVKYTSLYGEYIYRNYGNKFYAKSQNLIILLKRAYDVALEKYDVLVMPTLPSKAPKLPEKSCPLSGIFIFILGCCYKTNSINRLFAYCKGYNFNIHIWAWFGYFIF